MLIATKRSVLIGCFYSLVGISIGVYIAITSNGDGFRSFPIYAGLAAFITASILWRVILERYLSYKIRNGIIVGALSGILSHYVCWYLQIIIANIGYFLFGTGLSSLGEPPMDLLDGLSGAFFLSFLSLMYFGLLTVTTGGAVGGIYCWYIGKQRKIA
jgi:hypothetical protein